MNNRIRTIKYTSIALFLGFFLIQSWGQNSLTLYPAPEGLPQEVIGRNYTVKINNQESYVYRTEATGTRDYGSVFPEYTYFDFEGYVDVSVTPNYTVHTAIILPSRDSITATVQDNEISFRITEPGQYFVKINGNEKNGSTSTKNLYIFANPPEVDVPDKNDPNVVYFGPGTHPFQTYYLESNKTYYIAGGAFVDGQFVGRDVDSVTIRGRGIICARFVDDKTNLGRAVLFEGCNNIEIDGLNIMHPWFWTVDIFQSNDIYINNIHTISHGQSCDAVDIVSSHNVLVENCFLRAHDDILCVKTMDRRGPQSARDITFRNCVAWCDGSVPLLIGGETGKDVKNIRYEQIDILNMSRPEVWRLEEIMGIKVRHAGHIDSIFFKDIRVDVKVPQNSLFRFEVLNWDKDQDRGGGTGKISNVIVEDVWVNYEGTVGGVMNGYDTSANISKISFVNVSNNIGTQLTEEKVTANQYVSDYNIMPNDPGTPEKVKVFDISTDFSGFSDQQGRFNWYYEYESDGTIAELPWVSSENRWKIGKCYIGYARTDGDPYFRSFPQMSANMHPEGNNKPILAWQAPVSGTVLITGKVRRKGTCGDGAHVSIRKNNETPVWEKTIPTSNNDFNDWGTIKITVNENDKIRFVVDRIGNQYCDLTEWVPVITLYPDDNYVESSSLTVSPQNLSFAYNNRFDILNARVTPANASISEIAWTSSDEEIAIVNGFGEVTAVGYGDCKIWASINDGTNQRTDTCDIIVIASTLSIDTCALNLSREANSVASLTITSNTEWTITGIEAWLSASNTSGTGNATITLTAEENKSSEARTATLIIDGIGVSKQFVTVTQAGVTGISDQAIGNIIVYPNPADGIIHIDGLQNKTTGCIFNANGHLLIINKIDPEHGEINVAELHAGMYILKMILISSPVYLKFIKK